MSGETAIRPSARTRKAAEVARALIDGDWESLDDLCVRIAEALDRGLPRLPRKVGVKVRHTRSRPLPAMEAGDLGA